MNLIWLLRLKRWVQHPPSKRQIWLILGVVGFCLAIYAVERWIGWPDFLTLEPQGRNRMPVAR